MADILSLFEKLNALKKPKPAPVQWLVACLGNPGKKYENTRHNAGFIAADYIAGKRGFTIDRLRFKSLTGQCIIAGQGVLFIKPTTYMNLSGESVRDAMAFYKLPTEKLIVIFDDICLPPGRLRIRKKGSDGGHNGIKNIIYHLRSDEFLRIKIGVGNKAHPEFDLAGWVLSIPGKEEAKAIEAAIINANEALDILISGRTDVAMNRFNAK